MKVSSFCIGFDCPEAQSSGERLAGRRRKVVYYAVLDRSLYDLESGDKGVVECERGETPTAPTIMSVMEDGEYELRDGTLSIVTDEFTLRVDPAQLKTGLNPGTIEHHEFGTVEVRLDFEDEDEDEEGDDE